MITETSESEWSDFQAKLATKSLDVLGNMIDNLKTGKTTPREVSTACGAMFETISGLAPWETTDLIYAVKLKMDKFAKASE